MSREAIQNFDISVYVWEVVYCFGLLWIKLSILTFYDRLQPSPLYKWTIAVVTFGSCAFIIVQIFQCWPIHEAWAIDDHPHSDTNPKCVNDIALTYAVAGFNVASDIWIWLTCLNMLRGKGIREVLVKSFPVDANHRLF